MSDISIENNSAMGMVTVTGTQTVSVTYNLMNRPGSLSGGGYSVGLDYDANGVRRHTSVSHYNSPVREKTRLSSLFETEETPTANRRIDYVHAEERVVAVRVYENGTGSLYYVLAGHEHYDFLRVINAKARLYDPVIGRFFSPDPFVQAPDFTQNYNRYSYCMNNPVMYNDPNGEWVHIVIGAVAGGVQSIGLIIYTTQEDYIYLIYEFI